MAARVYLKSFGEIALVSWNNRFFKLRCTRNPINPQRRCNRATFKLYHGPIKAPSQTSATRQTNHILQYHAYMSCDDSHTTLLDTIASHRTASHHPHRAAQMASPTLDRPHHVASIACIAPHHSYCIANIASPT